MVDLVLDNLGGPAGEGLAAGLELFVLPLDLDGAKAPRLPGAGEGQAALLGLIGAVPADDDGVAHDKIGPLVAEGDDALVYADHVRRHAHASVPVGGQRVQQVLRRAEIIRRGGLGLLREKALVPADITDHTIFSFVSP